ncbi:hypothetical protein E2562_017033 [Oryza meyeriana var. granulata]|uniref:Isopropylmalate dehydrogenase-like domain-containing protein n=1 Tax=Oryza meyeriana var. granulata TaxID=110450 RepID=A0A6G1EBH5_9ORYZ|nr:hypothetical protein E2562_017033 [Oryza meyeriana var. granulata]
MPPRISASISSELRDSTPAPPDHGAPSAFHLAIDVTAVREGYVACVGGNWSSMLHGNVPSFCIDGLRLLQQGWSGAADGVATVYAKVESAVLQEELHSMVGSNGSHAFGDQYRATDEVLKRPGKLKLVFEGKEEQIDLEAFNFTGAGGVALSMHNADESIRAFADASMTTAYEKKWPLYLSTKNTILNGRFKDIFQEVYEAGWKSKFEAAGIWAKLDDNARLVDFVLNLEAACVGTVESGKVTKDLALLIHGSSNVTRNNYLNTEEFSDAELRSRLAANFF